MKRFNHILATMLIIGFLGSSCSTTIYMVRHAEKAPQGNMGSNVDLSAAGHTRAIVLRDSLLGKTITAIYATEYNRTQQTVAPTAQDKGLVTKIYRASNGGIPLIDSLSKRQKRSYLVAGHSNTIPNMVRSLGLDPGFTGDIPESDYDNLFVVRINWFLSKSIRLEKKTYGVPTQ